MNFLRPKYQKEKKFKNFVDILLNKNFRKYLNFLKKNYDKDTNILFNKFKFLFDEDLKLTIKDRLMAPKYKTYVEKELRTYLKKIGFKDIKRVKKKWNLIMFVVLFNLYIIIMIIKFQSFFMETE